MADLTKVAIPLAAASAVIVQPLVLLVLMLVPALIEGADVSFDLVADISSISTAIWVVAGGFIVFLGIPIFIFLKHKNRINYKTMGFSGFVSGAIPLSVYAWPLSRNVEGFSYSGNWHGMYVQFVIDGEHTVYGWLSYAESVLRFGFHGLIGAMTFYMVWRKLAKPDEGRS